VTTSSAVDSDAIFTRNGNSVVFNQLGVKLELDSNVTDESYYAWLDEMIKRIGTLVAGAQIAEKSYARTEPRLNTGVYYDTLDRKLLRSGAVLRTTCNVKTHAFCAFKAPTDQENVRRDHRYIFEGEEKAMIQSAPRSPSSFAIVRQLLGRTDIDQPGVHLLRSYGIRGDDLTPSICIEQYRHPFYVWLDKKDALRCTMDRAYVSDMRHPSAENDGKLFSEIELPLFPRIESTVARDPRTVRLMEVLSASLADQFGTRATSDNKYQRAAKTLGIT